MVELPSITTVRLSSTLVPGCTGWTVTPGVSSSRTLTSTLRTSVPSKRASVEMTLWLTATTRVPSERGSSIAST